MGLVDELTGTRTCIDTAPFIYYVEGNKKYQPILNPIFKSIDSGSIDAITSTITLLEVLVHPYKTGNDVLAGLYRDILIHAEGLTIYEVNHEISEKASFLRAAYSIRTPDAIQISTGILYGAETIVTNDSSLKKVSEINVLLLDDFLAS